MSKEFPFKSSNSPLKIYLKKVSDKENEYKTIEDVNIARANWELYRDKDEAKKRNILSRWLRWISVVWLGFSAIIIVLFGCGVLKFGEGTAMTFIASSLLEVFGLWKIALNYFFGRK